jgi:hypothetical protein
VAWQALIDGKGFKDLPAPAEPPLQIPGKTIEAGLLDRQLPGAVRYRVVDLSRL